MDKSKRCAACKENKALGDFHKDKGKPDGLETRCISCIKVKDARSHLKNKDAISARRKKARLANIEEARRIERARYEKNRDAIRAVKAKYKAANPDVTRKALRKYSQANKGWVTFKANKRRAQKLKATPLWFEKEKVLAIYKEASEMRKLGQDMHVDHIEALLGVNVCGLHCIDNLQILDARENLRKGNR